MIGRSFDVLGRSGGCIGSVVGCVLVSMAGASLIALGKTTFGKGSGEGGRSVV